MQLPFLHRELFERYNLNPPKGVLLYGPPGNGKTLIAKAVAHMLAEGTESGGVFLSVKAPSCSTNSSANRASDSPDLRRARERAASGRPVIVFIDEMDSLLRTRGSGVSSDVETTIVPQFLAELDGVEQLDNVMVIGASNRVDMIDPAVLRPGRLDVKIRVDRPGPRQADDIIRHYLTDDLPLEHGVDAHALARVLVGDILRAGRAPACVRRVRRARPMACHPHVRRGLRRHAEEHCGPRQNPCGQGLDRNRRGRRAERGHAGHGRAGGVPGERGRHLDADPVQWSRIAGFESGSVTRIRPAGDARTA